MELHHSRAVDLLRLGGEHPSGADAAPALRAASGFPMSGRTAGRCRAVAPSESPEFGRDPEREIHYLD
jgi:hypothetical protein